MIPLGYSHEPKEKRIVPAMAQGLPKCHSFMAFSFLALAVACGPVQAGNDGSGGGGSEPPPAPSNSHEPIYMDPSEDEADYLDQLEQESEYYEDQLEEEDLDRYCAESSAQACQEAQEDYSLEEQQEDAYDSIDDSYGDSGYGYP
jgi:hypothetical protein